MYERMLDKQTIPTLEDMVAYCGANAERFSRINEWLGTVVCTEQKVVFPYGNKYGWGIGHYKKKKLVCNVFAEAEAFTVMLRLSNAQFDKVYDTLGAYSQKLVDGKYPCGDGGWLHYRVICQEHYDDVIKLLEAKCFG